MKKNIIMQLVIWVMIIPVFSQQSEDSWQKETISTQELLKWEFLGQGELSTWGDQLAFAEAEQTKGVTLLSPKTYGDHVKIEYKVLALTPATVIVVMLSASDVGEIRELTIPSGYDGSIGLWSSQKENYFFAFKNAPHDVTPFVRKNPNADEVLGKSVENKMIAGVYYQVEVGWKKDKLWLVIDGQQVFETTDPDPLTGGHIALRLRGTAGFRAACLIKDFTIYSLR